MFNTSEEAMEGKGQAVTFQQAKRELANHGMATQEPTSKAFEGFIFVSDGVGEYEAVALNSKAILEWLGY